MTMPEFPFVHLAASFFYCIYQAHSSSCCKEKNLNLMFLVLSYRLITYSELIADLHSTFSSLNAFLLFSVVAFISSNHSYN